MERTTEHSVDHIDPRWKEGRDYQLVCGLDVPRNKRYLEWSDNARKLNRFIPYRIDDRVPVHKEEGDWGFFLIRGEWKLTQFMGREWWEESNRIGNGHNVKTPKKAAASAQHSERMKGEGNPMYGVSLSPEAQARRVEKLTGRKASQETRDKMSETRRGIPKSPEHKKRIAEGVRRARARVKVT